MARCALCHLVFPSRLQLVEHFSEAHSIARQRSRRSRMADTIRKMTMESHVPEIITLNDQEEEVRSTTISKQPFSCARCEGFFATPASLNEHKCTTRDVVIPKKEPVVCQYCGQKCKDRRGAAIHQAFCEKKLKSVPKSTVPLLENKIICKAKDCLAVLPECPAEDCGAIFKSQVQLDRHMQRHHGKEYNSITQTKSILSPQPKVLKVSKETSHKPLQPPLVTVTMKPHVGKTDGLQDLSLLITPTKIPEGSPEYISNNEEYYSSLKESNVVEEAASITVEEYRTTEAGFGIKHESVLYVTEDGSDLQAEKTEEENSLDISKEETYVIVTNGDLKRKGKKWKCSVCQQWFKSRNLVNAHNCNEHLQFTKDSVEIKLEPLETEEDNLNQEVLEEFNDKGDNDDDDDDWEAVVLDKKKKTGIGVKKGKTEYKCHLCKRHFLSELGFQTHVRNKECKNKKFKLPRMFSCHFKQCDSTFFKLTELQRHWQIAHKYFLPSKNLEFVNEKSFTDWLIREEEKHKVRFTCDVKRRKPHRSEKLLVCHRFHHLRTAAARKNAKREYSDRHNWIHKIQPCLCFARLKVYQQFNEETCDYTGKISVVYYHEHTHPKNTQMKAQEEVLEHVLQRNKRNRSKQFQDLTGNEKLLHRLKLERLARLAGRECQLTRSARNLIESSRKLDSITSSSKADDTDVHVDPNLLEPDELFASQVEMVLDGQFDMGSDPLADHVVTPLDSLNIFSSEQSQGNNKEEDQNSNRSDGKVQEEQSNREAEEDEEEKNKKGSDENEETVQAVLPATNEDWKIVFEMVRARLEKEEDAAIKAAATLLLPYEKVIELVTPAEQVPIFRQLWELASPSRQSQESLDFEIMVLR